MAGGLTPPRSEVPPALLYAATWTSLAVAILALLATTLPVPAVVRHLGGAWTATDGVGVAHEVQVPGALADMGFDPYGTVRLSRELTLDAPPPGDPWTIWLERPQHVVEVRWNGELVRQRLRPSDRSIMAVLPPGPAVTGVLEVTITGHGADSGLLERNLLGPQSVVEVYATHERGRLLGLAVGFALLGLVHLGVTAGRAFRPSHFYFGLMCAAGAVATLADGASAATFFDSLHQELRVRVLGYTVMIAASIGFLTTFAGRRVGRLTRVYFGACAGIALMAVVIPDRYVEVMDAARAAAQVISAPWALALVTLAVRGRVPGALWMTLTLGPVAGVSAVNAIAGRGMIDVSAPYIVPVALWIGGASAALLVRHAAEARRHRRLVTGSTDGMVIADVSGLLSDANPAARHLLGDGGQDQLLAHVVETDQPSVRAHLQRAMEAPDQTEFRIRGADGEPVVVESNATPIDSERAILVLRDVTRRRRVDDGLLQAARMETVGVLVGGIAHDFNNMLGTLMGHIGILQATQEDEALLRRLGRMEASIERASLLTRRLLTLARGTGSALEPVAIGAVVKSASELVEPTLPPDVTLHAALAPDEPLVLGAANDLEHVLVNLLVNARDAVGDAGRITIRTRPYAVGGARGMAVMVEDDGPGIPEALRTDVFTPFFTTKGPKRGSGLGLAVASQILRDHHGRIWVEAGPGGGARLILALRHADTRDEAPAPLPDGRDVVLVEDEDELRAAFHEALTRAGYRVAAFATGRDAWLHLQHVRPDALVTDVVMAEMDGIELARRFQRVHPETPVLLVSGFIPEADLTDTLDEGPWQRLDKPVRSAHLVSTVGRMIRRAERARRGELDITQVSYLLAPLDGLNAHILGFDG